jgi:hypothetical protein
MINISWHLAVYPHLSEKPVYKIKLPLDVTFIAFLSAINDIKFVEHHIFCACRGDSRGKEDKTCVNHILYRNGLYFTLTCPECILWM